MPLDEIPKHTPLSPSLLDQVIIKSIRDKIILRPIISISRFVEFASSKSMFEKKIR